MGPFCLLFRSQTDFIKTALNPLQLGELLQLCIGPSSMWSILQPNIKSIHYNIKKFYTENGTHIAQMTSVRKKVQAKASAETSPITSFSSYEKMTIFRNFKQNSCTFFIVNASWDHQEWPWNR